MGINAQITAKYNDNTSLVEMSSKKGERVRCYRVPNYDVDSFITDYKKNEQKSSICANTAFGVSVVGGVLLTSLLLKKMQNKLLKWFLSTGGGVLAATGAISLSSNFIEKGHKTLLEKHHVVEIKK